MVLTYMVTQNMLRTGKVYFYEFKFETAVNPNKLNALNGSNYRDYTLPISIQCKYLGRTLIKGLIISIYFLHQIENIL